MFKKMLVIAVVVGSVGMNGCGTMGGAMPGQTATGQVLGGVAPTAGGAFAPTSMAGLLPTNLAPRPAAAGPQIIPGVTVPNAAGQQNLGNGLIWDSNIMGYRASGTGERLTPVQAEAIGAGQPAPITPPAPSTVPSNIAPGIRV